MLTKGFERLVTRLFSMLDNLGYTPDGGTTAK